jgi:phosphoserine phosphatase
MRGLAEREGIDLTRSTAYSDSHTDLAFLEAVGNPVAVNPDKRLRAIALTRDWPVLTFSKASPRATETRGRVWARRRPES